MWRYTTFVDFLDHWQSLLAGIIALIAAVIAMRVTLKIEQKKFDRELDALRKSLAIELRQLVPKAFKAYESLHKLAMKADGPITTRIVESYSRVPIPIVYPANAHKIGLLEADAMDVVIVYGLLEIARDGTNKLMRHRTPDDIDRQLVSGIAQAFLETCRYARVQTQTRLI